MARKPHWVNLSVVYHLFLTNYREDFTKLTFCMQMMLIGDYVGYLLSGKDSDFRKYIADNITTTPLSDYCRTLLMMHTTWGVEE